MKTNTYRVTDYGVQVNTTVLQTMQIQAVLDMCRKDGGTVIFPRGAYYVSSLWMWSNTTLYLEAGAEIFGSTECEDYEVFAIPEDVEMRSDMELITEYYGQPWETYRRAMISSYGQKNIAIIGEFGAALDGQNCYDPDGEEGYRGPHIVFFSCCENVELSGYTARHSGNFLHEVNNCRNLHMHNVTCLGGSDGIHLHCTEHAVIEDCFFKTGDDCIAGININDLQVRRCVLNTSCNGFRIGGVGIYVRDCYVFGPGYYPHRKTVVKGKFDELPREQGRHNLICLVDYFASANYPYQPSELHFENCVIENATEVLHYHADKNSLQKGTYLGSLTLKNVRFTDLSYPTWCEAPNHTPATVTLKDVSWSFKDGRESPLFLVEQSKNLTVEIQ